MENKNNKSEMIRKLLEKSFIHLDKYSEQEIIDIDFIGIYSKIGIDSDKFIEQVSKDKSRHHSKLGVKYSAYVVSESELCYTIFDKEYKYETIEAFRKVFREIDLNLLNKLLEYFEGKINITELALHIKNKK